MKDVPYSRLVDASPSSQLPQKLDSDSKLNSERSKSILSVPEIETAPKSSASDSKLAVDYFNATDSELMQQSGSPQSLPLVTTEPRASNTPTTAKSADGVNISDSHHSLCVRSDSEERLKQEVSRDRTHVVHIAINISIFLLKKMLTRYNERYRCRPRIIRKLFIRRTRILVTVWAAVVHRACVNRSSARAQFSIETTA